MGSPHHTYPQIDFLVDYIGVLKNPVSRAAKAPAVTIAGSTGQQQQASIERLERDNGLVGEALRVFFMR